MRSPACRRALLASLVALALPVAAAAQQADLVLLNGRVFTADPLQPWAEAVAIRDGRFVAVGTTESVRALAGSGTRIVDLGTRVVVPGFNDAHMHMGPGDDAVDLRFGARDPSLATLEDSVRAAVARVPRGTWLSGAIGETALGEAAAVRAMLDRVAPEHPVRLEGWTGHGVVLNATALRIAGIDERATDPAGGWYERTAGGTIAVAHGYAKFMEDIRSIAVQPDSMARDAIARQAGAAAALGITTIQAMPLPLEPTRMMRLAGGLELPVRLRVIAVGDAGRASASLASLGGPSGTTYASGVKWFADGTPVERNAVLTAPYTDRPSWHGRGYLRYDMLRDGARAAAEANAQPMFHAVGDSTIALVFRALREAAPDSTWRRLRPRIEHGDFLTREQLDDARRLGVVLVQNPAHLMIPDVMGPRVGARMPDSQLLASVLRAGVPLAIGTDGPMSPFLNLMFVTMHPGNPAEALTMEDAVVAYTYGSAFAEGIDDKGMIAPGMLADLAVLSQDIFALPAQALPGTTVLMTVVGGRVVHESF